MLVLTFEDNVKLRIDKKVEENHFSIYSYDEFVKDILMLSIEQVMISLRAE